MKKRKNRLIFILSLLFIACILLVLRIHLSNVHHSRRYLGSLSIPCLKRNYKIKLYQGNENFESAQSLQFSLEDKSTIILEKYFGGTSDFDRNDARDFSIACKDSSVYIIFEKTDTMERIDLRLFVK